MVNVYRKPSFGDIQDTFALCLVQIQHLNLFNGAGTVPSMGAI